MTRPSLKSRFGEQIRAFVGYKNSLGFPYDESIRILGRFDDFCVERFPEKDCLDCELASVQRFVYGPSPSYLGKK